MLQELRTISVDVCSETLQKDLEAELSGQVVDVLINSAGVTHAGSFLETSLEDFEARKLQEFHGNNACSVNFSVIRSSCE